MQTRGVYNYHFPTPYGGGVDVRVMRRKMILGQKDGGREKRKRTMRGKEIGKKGEKENRKKGGNKGGRKGRREYREREM